MKKKEKQFLVNKYFEKWFKESGAKDTLEDLLLFGEPILHNNKTGKFTNSFTPKDKKK